MKFISWNVNGLNAVLKHGLLDFIKATDADIYAFQETKLADPRISLTGYYTYKSSCQSRRGYSGTLCLTKYEPLAVAYDFTAFTECIGTVEDCEGRIITMEFPNFYFVNAYFPNPLKSRKRYDYRLNWDRNILLYLENLSDRKPVIICGDFNVTVSDKDVYQKRTFAYLPTEQEAIYSFLNMGFADSFRSLHPNEKNIYSWWPNREEKRLYNQGKRLDYFLISRPLISLLQESAVMMEVTGSDHCPVSININLSIAEMYKWKEGKPAINGVTQPKEIRSFCKKLRTSYADNLSLSLRGKMWNQINWEEVEEYVFNMQKRLSRAAALRNKRAVTYYQNMIVSSIDARLLAVRHVCSTNSIPGVDNVTWVTATEKMTAAMNLKNIEKYHAKPSRLIMVKSKKGKTRRIHINTWYDRAMQCLFSLALDPVSEACADGNSFAFRKGRSHMDLHYYIEKGFRKFDWAFVADVRQCYERISHSWVMKNIPMNKKILKEFLSAGYILNGQFFPTDEGVGIGMNIAPIIANMVLDGLQDFIYRKLYPEAFSIPEFFKNFDDPEYFGDYEEVDSSLIDYNNGTMLRYADDIMVITKTREEAEKVRDIIIEFLEPRGLELSPEKSRVVNIREGFEFMSCSYVKKYGRVFSYPSKEAVCRFMRDLKETVDNHGGSQRSLIEKLNAKLTGWSTYHKVGDAQEAFNHVDIYLKALLLDFCERKHPKWSRDKIFQKYWYKDQYGNFRYALPDKKEVYVKAISDTVFIPYSGVWPKMNPYHAVEYLEFRKQTREIRNVSGAYKIIWQRQEGRCYYCGCRILRDQERMLVIINNRTRKKTEKYAYIHTCCAAKSINYIESDTQPDTSTDLMALLKRLNSCDKSTKFQPLSEFFRTVKIFSVTMDFQEVETILGFRLGKAVEKEQWWYKGEISRCWTENGYEIKKLDVYHRRITFHRVNKKMSSVEIPDLFFTQRIPDEAKYELENYFSYLIKKYGL